MSATAAAVLNRRFWVETAPLIVLCLLPILLYLPSLGAPFERDEGVYATIARGVLHGQVPYRDLFDNKPPLVYGWYAFSFLLFGESVIAPRIVAAVLLSCTTFFVFKQARMAFPLGVAYVAAGAFALSTGLPFVALHANTEAYMLLPLMSSLVAFTVGMRDGRLRWFLLAGVLGAVAMMTKQVAVWNLITLAAVVSVWHWRREGLTRRSLAPAAALLAGSAVTTALIAVPFAVTGALDELLYANLSYNWLYMSVLTYGQRLADLGLGLLFFSAVAAPFIGSALMGLMIIVRRKSSVAEYLLIFWGLASVVGVASGGRFFPHYFLQLMPALAVLAAVAVYHRLRERHVHPVHRPAMALALFLVVVSVGTNAALYIAPHAAEQRVAASVYEQKQWEEDSKKLGEWIAARTDPDDKIFNWGREAQIYAYADRDPAVRYFYDWAYWYDERNLPATMQALREAMPVYIIDSAQRPLFQDWRKFHPPELMLFISENYEYAGRIYFADVYRLKDDGRRAMRGLSGAGDGSELDLFMTQDYAFQ
ncbi:MAG: glycosyltransferase family 39 protein [Dehalococcoidia bacterium]|nr:glycosyltransferase family 39 protein [Dehalococcoidia bacterium]